MIAYYDNKYEKSHKARTESDCSPDETKQITKVKIMCPPQTAELQKHTEKPSQSQKFWKLSLILL